MAMDCIEYKRGEGGGLLLSSIVVEYLYKNELNSGGRKLQWKKTKDRDKRISEIAKYSS